MDSFTLKRLVREAVVAASSSYMKKERVRESLQRVLQDAVASGEVSSQDELDDWWNTLDMATSALRAVPFDAWKRAKK